MESGEARRHKSLALSIFLDKAGAMKRKLEELEYETRNMSIMIQKMDKCFEVLRQGAITDFECKQFLRAARNMEPVDE